ncbi:MAG: DUF2341 domain-containing protein [Candidatus Bathyarchaeia archaeon]
MKRLRHDNRGISNVIVVMLSLVLVVIIVSNVILSSYQMNEFDWERMQENVEIVNVAKMDSSSWSVAQNEYAVNVGSHVSGSYVDTQAIDGRYETFMESNSGGGWLGGWSKRIGITIDHSNIDNTLNDFPVMLYLSNSSGRFGNDVSCVFDELQSAGNRKKIAITTSDGITQCFVEIEKWDATNREAWLWTKVPSISSSQDTLLYLYYDKNQADNTAHVGDTGSLAAMNVWDSNFKLVMHLAESSGVHQDSTSNSNVGVPQGGVTQGVSGEIDGADAFDGTNGRVQTQDSPSLDFTNSQLTIEAWVKLSSLPTTETVIARKDNQWQIGFINSHAIRNLVKTNGADGWTGANDENYPFQTDTWYYWTFTYDGSQITNIEDAQQVGSTHTVTGNIVYNSAPIYLAYCVYSGGYLNGIIDEVRVSNVARSDAWIKASYESDRDNLVVYGAQEVQGGQSSQLEVVGTFSIDLGAIPFTSIQTVEIQLKYRANDSGENWYLKAFNWTLGEYSDSGFNSTAGNTPTTDWDNYALNLTDQWRSYVTDNGMIYVKLQDGQMDVNQTFVDIDFLGVRAVVVDGATFTLQNKGSVTAHLVSLWVDSTAIHQRYDMNLFIIAGDSVNYTRADISLVDDSSVVKVVTERGTVSVFKPSWQNP